jgi:hypothetical protein
MFRELRKYLKNIKLILPLETKKIHRIKALQSAAILETTSN